MWQTKSTTINVIGVMKSKPNININNMTQCNEPTVVWRTNSSINNVRKQHKGAMWKSNTKDEHEKQNS